MSPIAPETRSVVVEREIPFPPEKLWPALCRPLATRRRAGLNPWPARRNSSLEGNTRRALDIPQGGVLDEEAFKALIRAAVALNTAPKPKRGG